MHFAQPEAHTRALAQLKIYLDNDRELVSLFRTLSGQANQISPELALLAASHRLVKIGGT